MVYYSREAPKVGARLEMPVHYDCWMRGARFGTVTRIAKHHVWVKLDHPAYRFSKKLWRIDYEYAKVID